MLKVAILGYGGRGKIYARYCKQMKKQYEIKAIIDNSKEKLDIAKKILGEEIELYSSLDKFIQNSKQVDYIFICTQDKDHYEHTIQALKAGYNILLEKPIACTLEECVEIALVAKKRNLKVDVCHVLRYSGYYEKIKEVIESGKLGKIISIEQVENVAYWHQAHSFVRGDWRSEKESTPMIIAKCCHDLDIAVFLADSKCKYISSMGKLNFFNKKNKPDGATEFCMNGCSVKSKCPYDCEKLYINPLLKKPKMLIKDAWPQSRLIDNNIVTIPKLYDACLNTRFGKCVFLSNNDVVDYQTVNMEFENGITSTLIMTAFSGKESYRETRIRGSLGELICNTKTIKMKLNIYGKKTKTLYISPSSSGPHGGGDKKMIKALAEGNIRSDIEMSIESHLIGFAAEKSRKKNGELIEIESLRRKSRLKESI